ncbi:MAG TPA: tripartite tricarboxylate transporter substrate binding protein [Alphaproteobacteria bacterium]
MKRSTVGLLLGIMLLAASPAAAQTYPTRPITLTHGFGAGGNADTIARLLAGPLTESLGQPVIVEPRIGASGIIAADRTAKARPDGHTLVILPGGHAVAAALYKSLPFDPLNDFQMISLLTSFPMVISVRKDHRFRDIADLIAQAKAKPGAVTFSSVGIGSTQHLTGELLAAMTGVQLTHIPYKGGSAPLTDLLGGQIEVMIDTLTVTTPQLEAGVIRALAITSRDEWPLLPGIPPVAATVPDFDVRSWLSLATTRGVPRPIIDRLNQEVRKALASAPVKARLEGMGNQVTPDSPDEMQAFMVSEAARWTKVIRDAKVEQQ